jgi:hypothetical protein
MVMGEPDPRFKIGGIGLPDGFVGTVSMETLIRQQPLLAFR